MTKLELEMTNHELEAEVIMLKTREKVRSAVRYRSVPGVPKPRSGWPPGIWDADKIAKCLERSGHTLIVDEHGIGCMDCPARWKDYGF